MRIRKNNLYLFLIISLVFLIYSLSGVKQRHDLIKKVTGDLDDVLVEVGLVRDATLHKMGNIIGICEEKPGRTR